MITRNIALFWNLLHFNIFKLETFIAKSIVQPVLVFIKLKDGKEYYEQTDVNIEEEGILEELVNPIEMSNRIIADTVMFFLAFMLHYAAINIFLAITGAALSKAILIGIAVIGAIAFNYETLYKEYRFLEHQSLLKKTSSLRKKLYALATAFSILGIFFVTAFSTIL
ncbi:hypothetical protein ACFQ1M_01935 [Sungkyunkwania multivorans]|uniref:Uncharacterized protein n=1 Tax=Sungkyunkwania multivorans TaxID=1173618 RepID=A0ABW3CT71_9FLAO